MDVLGLPLPFSITERADGVFQSCGRGPMEAILCSSGAVDSTAGEDGGAKVGAGGEMKLLGIRKN